MPNSITPGLIPAAQYMRMSRDRQVYSIANQTDAIKDYAANRGFEIVQSYVDSGKSGLTVKRRKGLRTLIADVHSGVGAYRALLVYDVTRWGRFQDTDESAYYEFMLRQAGVAVHYCAEAFENDGRLVSSILKHLKRVQAADTSRELSEKVYAGQQRIARKGFYLGGRPSYGLRRVLVSPSGVVRQVLLPGDQKAIQSDRVLLMPGPDDELSVVRELFDSYTREAVSLRQLAERLNARGLPSPSGLKWRKDNVQTILTDMRYTGRMVWNRRRAGLSGPPRRNPPDDWIVGPELGWSIVSWETFRLAATRMTERTRAPWNEIVMLDLLRQLLAKKGRLSGRLINSAPDLPDSKLYWKRFGGMAEAYSRVGYRQKRGMDHAGIRGRLRAVKHKVGEELVKALNRSGFIASYNLSSGRVEMTGLSIQIGCARHRARMNLPPQWEWRCGVSEGASLAVVARADETNDSVADYFVITGAIPLRLQRSDFNMTDIQGELHASVKGVVHVIREAIAKLPPVS
jgi:DNA invertase Pin-like site-specific DNA recombinase